MDLIFNVPGGCALFNHFCDWSVTIFLLTRKYNSNQFRGFFTLIRQAQTNTLVARNRSPDYRETRLGVCLALFGIFSFF